MLKKTMFVIFFGSSHSCKARLQLVFKQKLHCRPPKSGKMSVTNLFLCVTNSTMGQALFFSRFKIIYA
eukprot:UN28325